MTVCAFRDFGVSLSKMFACARLAAQSDRQMLGVRAAGFDTLCADRDKRKVLAEGASKLTAWSSRLMALDFFVDGKRFEQ